MEQDVRNVFRTLMEFTGYLLVRVEALESALVQTKVVSQQDIRLTMADAQRSLERNLREMGSDQYNQDFERAIKDTVQRLRGGLG